MLVLLLHPPICWLLLEKILRVVGRIVDSGMSDEQVFISRTDVCNHS